MNRYFDLLCQRKIDEANKYRKTLVPHNLVKFIALTSDEETNDKKFATLTNDQLWFSHVSTLNDPYEFMCMYIDHDKLAKYNYDSYILSKFDELINQKIKTWAVVSLSANSFDCLPMWAYYTNNYTGFCVEYEVINPDLIFPVGYEPNRIPVASIIANFYCEFQKMMERGEDTNPEVDFYASIIQHQLYLKHESWKAEKEYRIVYHLSTGIGKNISISQLGLKTKRICAGYNCTTEHKEKLKEICSTLNCDNLLETKISSTKYTLLEKFK